MLLNNNNFLSAVCDIKCICLLFPNSGTLYAYSSRLFHADGRMMPYAWNHTITYNPELGRMPYLVQELYTEAMDVSLGPNQDSVHFQLLASIAPGTYLS